jgi:hypothetical protein
MRIFNICRSTGFSIPKQFQNRCRTPSLMEGGAGSSTAQTPNLACQYTVCRRLPPCHPMRWSAKTCASFRKLSFSTWNAARLSFRSEITVRSRKCMSIIVAPPRASSSHFRSGSAPEGFHRAYLARRKFKSAVLMRRIYYRGRVVSIAAMHARRPLGVTVRRIRGEHMLSALPSIAAGIDGDSTYVQRQMQTLNCV